MTNPFVEGNLFGMEEGTLCDFFRVAAKAFKKVHETNPRLHSNPPVGTPVSFKPGRSHKRPC